MRKKFIAMLLTACMLSGCTSSLAENVKHERVFAVLNAAGEVQSLTDSIRLENRDQLEEITDVTLLEHIQNVGGHESFSQDGNTLIWQAAGKDITWQGTSDRALPVTPVVTMTLDGTEVTADELAKKAGKAEITVTYKQPEMIPHLAATLILLPESGVSDLETENAERISLAGRQAVIGWSVPGADAEMNLPDSFTLRFSADHADFGWMMTFASADPIDTLCREIDSRIDLDLNLELEEAVSLLTALQHGETLPETRGKTREIPAKINELNEGLTSLNDGAQALAEGAATLKDGAASLAEGAAQLATGTELLATGSQTLADGVGTLNTGLCTLSENSASLNDGAAAIFSAILTTANQQLAAAGLEEAGIRVSELTAENYAEVLTQVADQLNPETLREGARQQIEAVVRPQVMENETQIRMAVEQTVQAQVLQKVLEGAGVEMDAETWSAAIQAGQVDATTAGQIQAAVDRQLASDPVKDQIDKAVAEQIDSLVQENTENYLATDETISGKLAQAKTAYDAVQALLQQLDSVRTFVNGVTAYTSGVDQAAVGAAELSAGAASLRDGAKSAADGAAQLRDGASSLSAGTVELADGAATLHNTGTSEIKSQLLRAQQQIAEKVLPYLDGDLRKAIGLFETTRDKVISCGYDLRTEDMKTVTVYILRTDLR